MAVSYSFCSVLCGLIGFMLIAGTTYDIIRRLQQKEQDKPGNKVIVVVKED